MAGDEGGGASDRAREHKGGNDSGAVNGGQQENQWSQRWEF